MAVLVGSEAHSLGAEGKSPQPLASSSELESSFSHLNSPGRPGLHSLLPFALLQCVSLEYSGGLVTGVGGVLSMEDIAGAGAAVVCASSQDSAATTALPEGPGARRRRSPARCPHT